MRLRKGQALLSLVCMYGSLLFALSAIKIRFYSLLPSSSAVLARMATVPLRANCHDPPSASLVARPGNLYRGAEVNTANFHANFKTTRLRARRDRTNGGKRTATTNTHTPRSSNIISETLTQP